ncbi:MAG: NAD(P)H-dependent oxidoreductase subunit E [Flavonifractor sp.]|jgi:NADH:ubiquinone oxidoreductase subunit E|nr:NAD(P)H-dependent oxidoreductase subunit E [Flavonifractor sp.]
MKPFDPTPDTLTPEGMAVIDGIILSHSGDSTQLVGILLDIQAAGERKYISRSAAAYTARKLGLKLTQVYDVITFYAALHDKPRAKYPLEVCSSAPCRVNDSDNLLDTLQNILGIGLGEVTYDGRFTIERVPCFGACDVAPAVRVNGAVYGNLTSRERILDMLRQLD